jgi:hypothetical protein
MMLAFTNFIQPGSSSQSNQARERKKYIIQVGKGEVICHFLHIS